MVIPATGSVRPAAFDAISRIVIRTAVGVHAIAAGPHCPAAAALLLGVFDQPTSFEDGVCMICCAQDVLEAYNRTVIPALDAADVAFCLVDQLVTDLLEFMHVRPSFRLCGGARRGRREQAEKVLRLSSERVLDVVVGLQRVDPVVELHDLLVLGVDLVLAHLVEDGLAYALNGGSGSSALRREEILGLADGETVVAAALRQLLLQVGEACRVRGLLGKAPVEIGDLVGVELLRERVLRAVDGGHDAVAGLAQVLVDSGDAEGHVAEAGRHAVLDALHRAVEHLIAEAVADVLGVIQPGIEHIHPEAAAHAHHHRPHSAAAKAAPAHHEGEDPEESPAVAAEETASAVPAACRDHGHVHAGAVVRVEHFFSFLPL